jgi:putative restriction endonuclease
MTDINYQIVLSAFEKIKLLEMAFDDDIPWSAIEPGFKFDGEKVFLANKAVGIFKPRQLTRGLLSIKTTMPRKGRINIYDDEEQSEGYFRYSLQKGDPYTGGNKHLWEAYEDRSPFIYFHAVAEGRYKAIWPCYISEIHPEQRFCEVVVGEPLTQWKKEVVYKIPDAPERKYAVRESLVRLHQATFRENVLSAYGFKCAISGLPVPELLEAAHITPDVEADGSAEVSNGISLSRLHHKAYDANLIGITPDYKIIISDSLIQISDGAVLKALQDSKGMSLRLPNKKRCWPERWRLEKRYLQFKEENF